MFDTALYQKNYFLKMEAIGSSKTVDFYQTTHCYNQDHTLQEGKLFVEHCIQVQLHGTWSV
jgi:hypothetical protein